ncbi:MAG: hypothetical protein ACPL06_00945 [Candidatus Anstonellales archaeon]
MELWRECARLIEFKKMKAENDYKLGYLERTGASEDAKEIIESENENLEREIEKIEKTLKENRYVFFVPMEAELERFGERLKSFKEEEIDRALRTKTGEAWDVLSARGSIIKRNVEFKEEIGKLIDDVNKLKNKERIIEIIKNGGIKEDVKTDGEKSQLVARIAKRMGRIGINVIFRNKKLIKGKPDENEVMVRIDGGVIWIPKREAESILMNEKKLETVSVKIQVKNAERQIKKFSEEEEKEFEELQKQYLELLKKREAYVKKYSD